MEEMRMTSVGVGRCVCGPTGGHSGTRAERLIEFKPATQCNSTRYTNRKGCDTLAVTDWRLVRFVFIFLLQFNK